MKSPTKTYDRKRSADKHDPDTLRFESAEQKQPQAPAQTLQHLSSQQRDVLKMQSTIGNQAVLRLLDDSTLQRDFWDILDPVHVLTRKRELDSSSGTSREEKAIKKMLDYGTAFPTGPLPGDPNTEDPTFGDRIKDAARALRKQMEESPSFAKLPDRLQAIVFALEQLNTSRTPDTDWMKTVTEADGSITTQGGTSTKRKGSVSQFGENAWKCNKMVADAYASEEGANVKNYPMGKDKNGGVWSPQANDFAGSSHRLSKSSWDAVKKLNKNKNFDSFPVSELATLSADGKSIVEITAFDKNNKPVSRYKLAGAVFEKYDIIDGKEVKTAETTNVDDIVPGEAGADIGDIVAFKNAERGESGHMGLNLGHDLFISALNATEGVGILSVKMHTNNAIWDKYSQIAFRRDKNR